jgi:hypothetical protein
MTIDALIDGRFWLPCACQVFNNLLAHFFDHIPEVIKPVFRIQQRFWKHRPFFTFLAARRLPVQVIPSSSTVRWDSAHALFTTLLWVWDDMGAFADQERFHCGELTPDTHRDLELLPDLTQEVRGAQIALEGDEFGAGSQFIGALLSIRHRIHRFEEMQPDAIRAFDDDEMQPGYCVYLTIAFLDPLTQFVIGRTCSETEFDSMRDLLEAIVQHDIDCVGAEGGTQDVDPANDDFQTFFSPSQGGTLDAAAQIDAYHELRSGFSRPFRDRRKRPGALVRTGGRGLPRGRRPGCEEARKEEVVLLIKEIDVLFEWFMTGVVR